MHLIDSDLLKRKKPSYIDNAVKAARSKPSRPQLRHSYSFLSPFYSVVLACLFEQLEGEMCCHPIAVRDFLHFCFWKLKFLPSYAYADIRVC